MWRARRSPSPAPRASASCVRGDALRRRRCAGMFFAKGRATRGKSANFSRNARAMREPGGLERRPTTRARRRTHEDHTTLPRRRATPQTALPRRWPAGWAICPIRSKMHDVQAERARRRLPGPASPWRPPGLHVVAEGGSARGWQNGRYPVSEAATEPPAAGFGAHGGGAVLRLHGELPGILISIWG